MRNNTILLVLFILGSAITVPAQTPDVSIGLYEERVYFPDTPVQILVTVANQTPGRVTFQLADDRRFNITIRARDGANRPVPPDADPTTVGRANQVFYRGVSLLPGEQISFVERLDDYVDLSRPDHYSVALDFSLDPIVSASDRRIASNTILVTVQPGETEQIRTEMRMQEAVRQVLQPERLSPDEVVIGLLRSRQTENWERFFLYLDVRSLYLEDPARNRAFVQMSEEEQLTALARYRDELERQERLADAEIVRNPSDFRILETRYGETEGQVVADLFFDFDSFRQVRRYTYELRRRNGYWSVASYTVINLDNEPLES